MPRPKLPGKKIQVWIDDTSKVMLEGLQHKLGRNGAQVIRDALSFYNWVAQETEQGRTFAMVDKSGKVRECILLSLHQFNPPPITAPEAPPKSPG